MQCLTMQAQRLTVYKISGNVDVVTSNGRHPLSAREVVTKNTVIDIKYDSKVIIFDEQGRKQYTLKSPGRATVGTLITDKRTTVIELTERYIKYIKSQVFGSNALVALNHNSDPATVTRDVDEALKDSLLLYATLPEARGKGKSPFQSQFDDFKEDSRKQFDDFRRACADRYASFARLAWEEMGLEPPVDAPRLPYVEPRVAPEVEGKLVSTAVAYDKVFTAEAAYATGAAPSQKVEPQISQPYPPITIQEQKLSGTNSLNLTLFDTRITLRYPAAVRLRLEECTENHVAEMIETLLTEEYDNLLLDCIAIRDNRHLCDWAYYQLLKAVGQALCPDSEDAATVVHAFLLAQTGYKMRMTIINGHLHLFVATDQSVYNRTLLNIEGTTYVSLEPLESLGTASVCNAELYDESQPMTLRLDRQPLLDSHSTPTRKIAAQRYPDFVVDTQLNMATLDFYDSYPEAYIQGQTMSRWSNYADAPGTVEFERTLYPALRQLTEGMPKVEAVERILNWVQTGLDYKKDEDVWGRDRVFFAEETLYYPYCDCEDRAILFTRIVRDILGLPCALVYYPGHLACAVHFDGQTPDGDYFEHDGKRYVIADPTYIGARLGMTMESKKGSASTIMILQ